MVVEAAWRSGSLVTARLDHEIGRPVGAVPGPVTAGSANGTNTLIKEGKAQLVTGADDIAPNGVPVSLGNEGAGQ